MKLVMVTAVEVFHKEIIKLFRQAEIHHFSEAKIDGYKFGNENESVSNWFGAERGGNQSIMFFSFTDAPHIEVLFVLIKEFNKHLETNNPLRVAVVPIEKFM
ncbi:hypothetical protein KFZ70_15700 [Tamlana fucoidanivorans]|uniref:DUF3240 domain-containing protein n=1 Tax=Allotamlana fucoidanivorans TaxID=2583814 RepID=A0A5C4SE07_9FLAO|nr:hypothetical protein [Tamlana fucoidanivorans]TNJ41464.1 hypothetical protein FGF67_15975 [Tamlana fucoidanivorans]